MSDDPRKVISLADKQEREQKLNRKQYLSDTDRLRELEEDMVRAIDMISYMNDEIDYMNRLMKRLFKLLKEPK